MPRPKKHESHRTTAFDWHENVLLEFVKKHPIPPCWGHSIRHRYEAARWLVTAAFDPTYVADMGLETFCFSPFFKDPDYAIALLTFARKKAKSFHQIEEVARLLAMQEDIFPRSRNGKLASDKEIAAFLEKQPGFNLAKLHPSVIGKARLFLALQKTEREKSWETVKSHNEALYAAAVQAYRIMTKTADFQKWYSQMQQKEQEYRARPITAEALQAKPKRGLPPHITFTAPAKDNQDLAFIFIRRYMQDGNEYRPHESPEDFEGYFLDCEAEQRKKREHRVARLSVFTQGNGRPTRAKDCH